MAALIKVPVLFSSQTHTPTPVKNMAGHLQGGFWNCRPRSTSIAGAAGLTYQSRLRSNQPVRSSSRNSPPGDSGSIIELYLKSHGEFVDCSVIEAVNMRMCGPQDLVIKMLDGSNMQCAYNICDNATVRKTEPSPVIVLRIEDGSNILFAIDTVSKRNAMLMDVIRDTKTVETTAYEVLKEMVFMLGYEVRLVRIEERNQELVARVYLYSQVGNEKHERIVEIRPADAIIIAVQCKALIQLNTLMAYKEGMRAVNPMDPPRKGTRYYASVGEYVQWRESRSNYKEESKSQSQSQANYEEEFGLIRNMMDAASEERYKDAARYRDMLNKLRQKQRKHKK